MLRYAHNERLWLHCFNLLFGFVPCVMFVFVFFVIFLVFVFVLVS